MASRVFVEWVDSGMSLDGSVWQTKDELIDNGELDETAFYVIVDERS